MLTEELLVQQVELPLALESTLVVALVLPSALAAGPETSVEKHVVYAAEANYLFDPQRKARDAKLKS